MNNQRTGAALVEEIRVVGLAQEGVCRDGDSADLHRGKICDDKLRNIRQEQHHALLFLDSHLEQRVACTIDLFGNFGVSKLARPARYRNSSATSFANMTVDEGIGDVIPVRNFDHFTSSTGCCSQTASRR